MPSQIRWKLIVAALALFASTAYAYILPVQPQLFDSSYVEPTGNVIVVRAGGDLQAALNSAQLGDTIELEAGATFTGPFTLPNKTTGTGWIYVRSSRQSSLPAPGTRVSIADAANMPKIVVSGTGGGSTLRTANGAHNFRFVGIEFRPVSGSFVYDLISIGNADTVDSTFAHHIYFDRCYIHGDATVGGRRGVAMNGKFMAVLDSYVADFKEVGADTQALWAYNTPGPIKVVNNYLEAAGENVMFGGAQPTMEAFIPADIEIRGNHFKKQLSWMAASWSVKNLIEFKLGIRVLVTGNTFENNWLSSQNGMAFLITPRNEYNSAPWAVTKDITIVNNTLINVGQAFQISGIDDGDGVAGRTSQRTERVLVRNNIISVSMLGGANGRLFQITGGPVDLTIDHNTGFTLFAAPSNMVFAENTGTKADRFTFTNNIFSFGMYGFLGTGTGEGLSTMNQYFSNYVITKNAVIGIAAAGGSPSTWPTGNYFPATVADVKFVNYSAGDYHLASTSPYKGVGTDGADLGANPDALSAIPAVTAPKTPANFVIK